MATFKKYDIGEEISVKINLSNYLSADHLSKQIEKIVSDLDTSFIESTYSNKGQNGYHPKMLLSILFYGYTIGIRSGRKLSIGCKENLAFIYLSKGHRPSKSVLNDFRKDNYQHFSNLFNQVLVRCMKLGLANPELSIIDGSKIRANSSKKASKTKEKYEKWQEHLQADIASIEKEITSSSEKLPEIKKKLKTKQNLSVKIKKAIKQLETTAEKTSLNLTDSDSPIMKGKKGNFDTYYNVQAACGEDQLITYCNVVLDGNDKAQLVPVLKGIVQNTGKMVDKVLADADYGNFDSFEYLEQNQIEGYVPYPYMNKEYKDKPFHKANFSYQKEEGVYYCPDSQKLTVYRTSTDTKTNRKYKHYRTNVCKQCPFQKKCCPKGAVRRVIKREYREDLTDEMKERLNSPLGQKFYQKRLHPIEVIFGHLKFNLKYTHFLLRGLEKVKAEFTLMCLTYNLRKMIGFLAYFSLIWSKVLLFMSQKLQKLVFPRIVNELGLNTFYILVIRLSIIKYNQVFSFLYSRSACTA